MSAPPILALRRAIVTHLKADDTVTALLPAGQIFGESTESEPWPFARCDDFEAEPGHEVFGSVHVFSKERFTDEVLAILEVVGVSLDGAVLFLDEDAPSEGPKAVIRLVRTRNLPDPEEQGAWHGIASIQATIAKDCVEA